MLAWAESNFRTLIRISLRKRILWKTFLGCLSEDHEKNRGRKSRDTANVKVKEKQML